MPTAKPPESDSQIGPMTLEQLAERVPGCQLRGNGDQVVRRLVPPTEVQSKEDIVLLMSPDYLTALEPNGKMGAQTAVVSEEIANADPPELRHLNGYVVATRVRYAVAAISRLFDPDPELEEGVHPSAVIHESATVDPTATIGANSYVGARSVIGAGTIILPNVTIREDSIIGEECLLYSGARVGRHTRVGNRVLIQYNAVVGADGFSFVTTQPSHYEVPECLYTSRFEGSNDEISRIASLGGLTIEDDVEIGACACADKATLGTTVIRKGTKIDNLVQIAHNTVIGENNIICAQAGIAGSARVGDRTVMGGQAGVSDHVKIGDDAAVMAQSGVMNDVPDREIHFGSPAKPLRQAFKEVALIAKLSDMRSEMFALKKRLEELEAKQPASDESES